jgi:hypothetical protein
MGCIARLGCLIVLAILAVIGWFTRDLWLPHRYRHRPVAAATSPWQPLNDRGAERARAALAKLSDKSGPAFQTIAVADLASYAAGEVSRQLSGTIDSIQTKTNADTVLVRGTVKIADLGGRALGSLASMLGDRESVQLAGTIHVLEPGLADIQVHSVKIRNFPVPSAMIPELIKRLGTRMHSTQAENLPPNALALPIPRSLGDIRISRGKATLYKSGQ